MDGWMRWLMDEMTDGGEWTGGGELTDRGVLSDVW